MSNVDLLVENLSNKYCPRKCLPLNRLQVSTLNSIPSFVTQINKVAVHKKLKRYWCMGLIKSMVVGRGTTELWM